MKKPIGYKGFAWDKPKQTYNKEYLKTKKGKKEVKEDKKANRKHQKHYKKYGYDETECWNLDNTISHFILPRLKCLKKIKHGYPQDLTETEWDEILDLMIKAFEINIGDEIYDPKTNKNRMKEFDIGIKLFSKYYIHLWD